MKFTSLRHYATTLFPLIASACGSDQGGGAVTVAQPDSGIVAAPKNQCSDNQTNDCTCPAVGTTPASAGKQSCYQGYWLSCSCGGGPPPAFDPNAGGDCLPGRYEGTFAGLYSSGFAWGGLPVPVVAIDPSGGPGLALTLQGQEEGGGSEFTTYTVSDGFIKGNADGIFPIQGVITGALNCSTKEFNGILDGWYSLALDIGVDINKGFFRGPVHAYYDASTHTFVQGTWNVLESSQGGALAPLTTAFQTGMFSPGQVVQNLGGNGDWNATWTSADGGAPTSLNPGILTGGADGGVAADAGVAVDGGP